MQKIAKLSLTICLPAAAIFLTASLVVAQQSQADSRPAGPGPRNVAPVREVDPRAPYQSSSAPVAAPRVPLMEEGRRLIERTGRLQRENDGSHFVFDESELSLRLLQNHFLQRMEDVSDFGARPMQFRLTMTVQRYRGQNYLLVSRAPEVVRSDAGSAGGSGEAAAGRPGTTGGGKVESSPGASAATGRESAPDPLAEAPRIESHDDSSGDGDGAASDDQQQDDRPSDDTEPDDAKRDIPPGPSNLEIPPMAPLKSDDGRSQPAPANARSPSSQGERPGVGSAQSPGQHGDGSTPAGHSGTSFAGPPRRRATGDESALIQEGRWLIDREGRLDRVDGQTRFIFDSGDEPITLLPNAKLERIEDISDYGRRGQKFRISGAVTVYRGRNYLLLSKVLIIPRAIEDL